MTDVLTVKRSNAPKSTAVDSMWTGLLAQQQKQEQLQPTQQYQQPSKTTLQLQPQSQSQLSCSTSEQSPSLMKNDTQPPFVSLQQFIDSETTQPQQQQRKSSTLAINTASSTASFSGGEDDTFNAYERKLRQSRERPGSGLSLLSSTVRIHHLPHDVEFPELPELPSYFSHNRSSKAIGMSLEDEDFPVVPDINHSAGTEQPYPSCSSSSSCLVSEMRIPKPQVPVSQTDPASTTANTTLSFDADKLFSVLVSGSRANSSPPVDMHVTEINNYLSLFLAGSSETSTPQQSNLSSSSISVPTASAILPNDTEALPPSTRLSNRFPTTRMKARKRKSDGTAILPHVHESKRGRSSPTNSFDSDDTVKALEAPINQIIGEDGKPVYECPFLCGMVFKCQDAVRKHAVHHTSLKTKQCKFCDQRFKTARDRTAHERSEHTDKLPMKYCPEPNCQHSFIQRKGWEKLLETHLMKKHPSSPRVDRQRLAEFQQQEAAKAAAKKKRRRQRAKDPVPENKMTEEQRHFLHKFMQHC
eukprot:m.48578 g.48578  ORF g.48578 m.48578 type:complete len:528 (-) comp17809_c0_seq1:33-1616(-)